MLDIDLIFSGFSSFLGWLDTVYISGHFSCLDFILSVFVLNVLVGIVLPWFNVGFGDDVDDYFDTWGHGV